MELWTVNIVRKSIKFQVIDCSVWLLQMSFLQWFIQHHWKAISEVLFCLSISISLIQREGCCPFFKRGEGSWRSWISEYLSYFPSMLHSLKLSLDSSLWLLSTSTPAISKTQLNGSCHRMRGAFLEALLSLGWLSVSRTRGRPCRAGWQCDLAAGNILPAGSSMCFVCSGGFWW